VFDLFARRMGRWPWWFPQTRSLSALRAMTPWTFLGLSSPPVWPVRHQFTSSSQLSSRLAGPIA